MKLMKTENLHSYINIVLPLLKLRPYGGKCVYYYFMHPPPTTFVAGGILFPGVSVNEGVCESICASRKPCEDHI